MGRWLAAMGEKRSLDELMSGADAKEGGGVQLKKCLSRWDVVAYGVSSTVGAGIFVITGQGALSAGPAIVISFILASLCCLCSALCYAEFAARVPISGSAYTFTYVCIGELAAWLCCGWNLTLEYAISAAAVARGWSKNFRLFWVQVGLDPPTWVDSIDVGFTKLSPLALIICLVCTAALLVGAKESAGLNKVITVMNVSCILFIIILGSAHVHKGNWTVEAPAKQIPSDCDGSGSGFVPCGFNGILTGAIKVFFSYIGFDSVTTLAEEVTNPRVDIPFGVMLSLLISAGLYVGTSIVITGMVPWYAMDSDTPLASAFKSVGVSWAATLIAIVTITALSVTTLCSLFGQPRIFFRMAQDGLLFKPFGKLTEKSQVPLWGTLFSGLSAGLIALALDIGTLSDMISMGTLMAFTTVCAGIVILRLENHRYPSLPGYLVIFFMAASAGLGLALRFIDSVPVYGLALLGVAVAIPTIWLAIQHRAPANAAYLCPLVPFLPLFGIFCNVYLIVSNTALSYYRIIGWTAVGMLIYFFYGIRNSTLRSWNSFRMWPGPTYAPGPGGAGHSHSPSRDSPNLQEDPSERDPLLAGY